MNRIKEHPLITFFVLAYLSSWLITGLMIARYNGILTIPGWLHYTVAWGPALAAIVVTRLVDGHAGMRDLFSRLFKWKLSLTDWFITLATPFLFLLMAITVSTLLNGTLPDLQRLGQLDYLGSIGIPLAILVWVLSFGIGEEMGWRGFAQQRLQAQHSLLKTAIFIGILWAFWHLPHFFYKDTFIEMGLAGFPFYAVNLVLGSIVLGWVYMRTESILAVGLWHGLFDFSTAAAIDGGIATLTMGVLVVLWAIYIMRTERRKTLSTDHDAHAIAIDELQTNE